MLGQALGHHQEVTERPPADEQAERRESVERGEGVPADGEADGIVDRFRDRVEKGDVLGPDRADVVDDPGTKEGEEGEKEGVVEERVGDDQADDGEADPEGRERGRPDLALDERAELLRRVVGVERPVDDLVQDVIGRGDAPGQEESAPVAPGERRDGKIGETARD